MRTFFFPVLFLLQMTAATAQGNCPKSPQKGVHTVQPGENLYRISKKYGVTVAELCQWNRISETSVLPKCSDLLVAAPKTGQGRASAEPSFPAASVPTDASAESGAIRQTEAERRAEPWREPETRPAEPQPAKPSTSSPSGFWKKTLPDEVLTGDDVHAVQQGETVEDIAARYGYRTWRFREINGLSENETVEPGRLLRNSECTSAGRVKPIAGNAAGNWRESPSSTSGSTGGWPSSGSAAPPTTRPEPTGSTVATDGIRSNTRLAQSEAEKAAEAAAEKAKAPAPSRRTDAPYMTLNERTMVDEINLVRSDPPGYVKYIEEYIDDQKKNGEMGNSIATARELIAELKKTPRLSQLDPSECVYRAAKMHGQQQAKTGSIDHMGTDGSWPWDRVLRECKGFEDANENLVGGYTDVRKSVIILLVDDGIDNRGHRRTLLEPKWKYVACYEIGPVKPFADYWVQNFGY